MPIAEKGMSGTAALPVLAGVATIGRIAIQVGRAGAIVALDRPAQGSARMPHAQVNEMIGGTGEIVRGRLEVPRIDAQDSAPQRRRPVLGLCPSGPKRALRLRDPSKPLEARTASPDRSFPTGLVPTEVTRA